MPNGKRTVVHFEQTCPNNHVNTIRLATGSERPGYDELEEYKVNEAARQRGDGGGPPDRCATCGLPLVNSNAANTTREEVN